MIMSFLTWIIACVAIHDNAYTLGGMLFIASALFYVGGKIDAKK